MTTTNEKPANFEESPKFPSSSSSIFADPCGGTRDITGLVPLGRGLREKISKIAIKDLSGPSKEKRCSWLLLKLS